MKRLFIGTAIAAALSFAAPSWAQKAEAPIPLQPSGAPSMPQPASSTPQPAPHAQQPTPRIDMPDPSAAARQGSTDAAAPMPSRYRAHRKGSVQATHVNSSITNYFTHQLNRQELESLQPGGGMPPAENPPSASRDLYPPQ